MKQKIWVDTDIAIGQWDALTGYADVDDAFALMQCLAAPHIEVLGISTVFGNTDVGNATRIAREWSKDFGPRPDIPVFQGAASALDLQHIGPDAATQGLQAALEQAEEKLSILAIGPASNIARLLLLQPSLKDKIETVVLVAGRRSPQQHFKVGPAHDPPFPDLNFDLDPTAFQVMLEAGVNMTLLPFEISHKVWVSADDLDVLSEMHAAGQQLANGSRAWLEKWTEWGCHAFNPFDLLASAWLIDPKGFLSEKVSVQIRLAPDDTQPGAHAFKPYLCCSQDETGPYSATYVHTPPADFMDRAWRSISSWKSEF